MNDKNRKYHLKMVQIFSTVIAATLLIFLVIDLLVAKAVGDMVLRKNIEYVDTVSEKISQELDYITQKSSAVFNFLQYSDLPREFFSQKDTPISYDTAKQLSSLLLSVNLIYPELDDIALVDKRTFSSTLKIKDLSSLIERFPDLSEMRCGGISVQESVSNDQYKIISFISNIYGNQTGRPDYARPIGKCVLSIRLTRLNWRETENQEGTYFLVLDENKNYYTINCDDNKAKEIISHFDSNNLNLEINNDNFLLKSEKITPEGLHVVSFTDKSLLLKDVSYVKTLALLLGGVWIFSLMIIALVVFRNLISPIYTLRDHMRHIADGNFIKLKHKVIVSGSREIVELTESLNSMTDELDDRAHRLFSTTNRLYEMEMEKQKAEIAFLRSQINPHFLYNSLEAIKGICMKNSLPEPAMIANNLGKIFRYSIKGGGVVPLSQEVSIACAFIDIQKSRFPHKLEVFYNFSDDTLQIPVCCMILQPIIENVFEHAVEKNVTKTLLYISSLIVNEDLIVTVQDDGIGISNDKLDEINKLLQSGMFYNSCHVGIANVHMRIKMMYGNGYGVSIESAANEGTKVILRMKCSIDENGGNQNGIDSNIG